MGQTELACEAGAKDLEDPEAGRTQRTPSSRHIVCTDFPAGLI